MVDMDKDMVMEARRLVRLYRDGTESRDVMEAQVRTFARAYCIDYPWDILAGLDAEMYPDAAPLETRV